MALLDACAIRSSCKFFVDVEQGENLFRRHRHERLERVGYYPQSFDQVGENLRDPRQLVSVLRQREWRGRDYVLVGRVESLPDSLERAVERQFLDQRRDARRYRGEGLDQCD